jgi:hypothetical protein
MRSRSAVRLWTDNKKKCRRDKELCLYCGGHGHTANACLNKSDKAKARDAACRQAASAQAGNA